MPENSIASPNYVVSPNYALGIKPAGGQQGPFPPTHCGTSPDTVTT